MSIASPPVDTAESDTPDGRLTWSSDAISFSVQIATHFERVTRKLLVDVVVVSTFDQKCIFAFRLSHSFNALLVRVDKNILANVHKFPHLLVHSDFRILVKDQND